MKTATIEEIAYIIKQSKANEQPKPIFFLGAGASKTGGIPLARDIVKDILIKYSEAPSIKNIKEEDQTYSKLMECLQPYERDKLLKDYIDEAKINVAHIYLAQLLVNDYVDYIFTVNFDNLILRALALFNDFPSTYDMAILKDLTTTTFKEKSVVFLHGQHHGLWLLNTEEEMKKVKETVLRIFDSIKNKRPWIFIGYSGDDPIFEHIQNLGRFDNGLYWVTYNDNEPNEKVKAFLETPNINAFVIKGYDADSFMLKLNNELQLEQPFVVNKPFTSLREMLNNIVDIDDDENFKGVKERLEISKKQVDEAILQFEEGEIEKTELLKSNSEIYLLKKKIINLIIKENYPINKIEEIEKKAEKIHNEEINSLLSDLYLNWGNYLGNLAKTKEGKDAEELYNQAFIKFQKAIEIKPDKYEAFYNWGNYLGNLAKTKEGKDAEELYNQAFIKFQKAIEIKPDLHETFYNWGTVLGDLAKTKEGKDAEELYNQAFVKFQKAIEIKPDKHEAYNNWGTDLGNLAKTKEGKDAEELYTQAFEKFQKAIEIKPDKHDAFYNWGTGLGDLAKTKEGKDAEELYTQAFEKFQKAIEIKPDLHEAYNNWGTDLGNLAKTKEGKDAEELYTQAFVKFQKAIEIKPDLHEAYNNWGTVLGDLAKTKEGKDAEELYNQAFVKFQKAIEIKPDKHEAFYNWGTYLGNLAKTKEGKDAEELYNQAFVKFQKAIEFGGHSYNISCMYALKGDIKNALHYLSESLEKGEITADFVRKDEDWKNYITNDKFNNVLMDYEK